jgi:hypothetical protein
MKKEDFLKSLLNEEGEATSTASVLGDPSSATYGGFIGPLSRISKKKLNSRLFHTWKDSNVKNGAGVGRIAIPPQGYVKEHLYSTEGNLVTENDLLEWFGGDLKQKPAYNGGQLVAIEPKCLAFPYCSQGAVDKPIKLIGESKEEMCGDCYGYCSHIAKETGKSPEFIAKLIREKYLSETIDMVKMENINESVIKTLNESIELLDENYTEENKNLENTNTMKNIQLTPEFSSKCMNGIMENNQLAECMYETLIHEGFLPETLNEGESYEGYCKTMMEDAEICMEMIKSCMMSEGSSCANEVSNYISERLGNKMGGSEEKMFESAYWDGVDPEEGGIYLEGEDDDLEDTNSNDVAYEKAMKAMGKAEGSANKYAKIEASVENNGARETAVKLVDTFIGRMLGGMSSSDLADTATFANGLDTIEEYLEDGNYQEAIEEAKNTAEAMLEDEGMGMDMFGEGNMVEAEGINPAIYKQLKYCIEHGHSYSESKQHVAKEVDGWNLSMEDYNEAKKKFGKGKKDGVEFEEGIHDPNILSRPHSNPDIKPLERSSEELGKEADSRSENMLLMKYSKQINNPKITDDELRFILSGKGVPAFGGRPNAIDKIIRNRNTQESQMDMLGGELKEGSWNVDPAYNYFAVNKATGQIFTGWEYDSDMDKEDVKYYAKMDIKDSDWEPKDFSLVTTGYLKKKGVDPHNSDNWVTNQDVSKYMDNLHGTSFSKDSEEGKAEYEINELVEGDEDSSRYMFFSNLEQIKRQADILMKFDQGKIEAILNSGHDWAADHMAVTKENLDQVFDFLMNEFEGEGAPEGDMTPAAVAMAPIGVKGPADELMEYDDDDADVDVDDDVATSDQYEREMKYFTNFMNSIEKSIGVMVKSLSSDEIKSKFNQYFSQFESSRDANADKFINFVQKTPEESYLEYSDRLFKKGSNNSILNLLTSPTKRAFLEKTGLIMDDNLTDALDTIDDLQPRAMKKAEFIKSYGEKQDSRYKDIEDDDFSDEKEPSIGDLKNVEKMGNFDVDNDDDFLEEAELAKFVAKKGKNVDSENAKNEKEAEDMIKDAEKTQKTVDQKVDNLKNQKHVNNKYEETIATKQHGRNSMLDLDYTNDTSDDFKDRIKTQANGLPDKPGEANVDYDSKGGEKLMQAVRDRREVRAMDYTSKGLNINKDDSYERSDALSDDDKKKKDKKVNEDVVSLEIQKMMRMVSYDQNIISEEKKAKQTNENDIFWKSVSNKKLL